MKKDTIPCLNSLLPHKAFFSKHFRWTIPLSPLSSCGLCTQPLFVCHALTPLSGGLQSLQRNGSCCQQLKWVCGCFVWATGLVILWVFSLYLTRIKPLLMRVEVSSAGCCCNSQGSHHLLLEKRIFMRPVHSSDFIFGFCEGKHVKTGQSEIPALCLFFPLHFFTPFLASVKRHAALRQWLTAQVRNVFCLSLWKCVCCTELIHIPVTCVMFRCCEMLLSETWPLRLMLIIMLSTVHPSTVCLCKV